MHAAAPARYDRRMSSHNAARWFLIASTLVWLPYGLYCWAQPGYLHDAAGVAIASQTGRTELRAMYGGLQAAIGLLTLLGILRPSLTATALTAVGTLCSGLFLARLSGVLLDGGVSAYTAFALVFESASALGGLSLARRTTAA